MEFDTFEMRSLSGSSSTRTSRLSEAFKLSDSDEARTGFGFSRRNVGYADILSEEAQINSLEAKERASALDKMTASVGAMEEYISYTARALTSLGTSVISPRYEHIVDVIKGCWRVKVSFSDAPIGYIRVSFNDAIIPKSTQLDLELFVGMKDCEIIEHIYSIHVSREGPFRGRDALLASGKYDEIREVRGNLYITPKGHSGTSKYIVSAKAVAGLTTEDALKMEPETLAGIGIGIYNEKEEREISDCVYEDEWEDDCDELELEYVLRTPKISRSSVFAERIAARQKMSKALSERTYFNGDTGLWESGPHKEKVKEETVEESIFKELSAKYLN